MNIVHLSPSVLAGAPGMLARAQTELLGHRATHLRVGDYGHFRDLVSSSSLALTPQEHDHDLFRRHVEDADVIHVHNYVPILLMHWISEIDGLDERVFIYQLHSPSRERPVFADLSAQHGFDWHARLVVAQVQPRMFPDHRPVPNCLYRDNISSDRRSLVHRPHEPVRVIFTPSTRSRKRWAAKTSPKFETALKVLKDDRRFSFIRTSEVSPERVMALRSVSDISIDEVVTGGFHLVSYEGLASGNAVINGADEISMASLAMGLGTSDQPPFVVCTEETFLEEMLALANNRQRLADVREAGFDYFWKYLEAGRIASMYQEIYES